MRHDIPTESPTVSADEPNLEAVPANGAYLPESSGPTGNSDYLGAEFRAWPPYKIVGFLLPAASHSARAAHQLNDAPDQRSLRGGDTLGDSAPNDSPAHDIRRFRRRRNLREWHVGSRRGRGDSGQRRSAPPGSRLCLHNQSGGLRSEGRGMAGSRSASPCRL